MKIINRKFHREYQELEKLEAGVVLNGAEVKSIRTGSLKLEDSFVKFIGEELYLINADVPIYKFTRPTGYDSKRSRKLLLHKKELLRLRVKMQSGGNLTMAPVSCYNKGHLIKLEIALVKGRKDVEKRKLDKSKDVERAQKREAKEYMKV
jgi:SsrA-binding protein